MEGRPRRGRRRRQSQDQAPTQHQGTVPTPEQTPVVGPLEDVPPPQAKETTIPPTPEEPAAQPSPTATPAEEQAQTMDLPPLAPPQAVQTTAPPPAPQQPPPAHRGDHRQAAGPPKGHQRDQRDHGRGDQAREGRGDQARGGDQGRGDQKGDQGRRLQDGIVGAWSIPIRMDSEIRRIEDTLRGIRKALEDECMIGQDDASERVLLDLALNAIRDRITIHRIQPVTRDLDETERLLRLRHQADRHIVEMLTALKSV